MERLKLLYMIRKDRLLLFSATIGASLAGYMQSNEIWLQILFLIGSVAGLFGVVKNLAKINKIEETLDV